MTRKYIVPLGIKSDGVKEEKSRMPLDQTIISQAVISAIVREIIKETLLHISRFRVSVNISQRNYSYSLPREMSRSRAENIEVIFEEAFLGVIFDEV